MSSYEERRPQLSDEAAAFVRALIIGGQLHSGDFIRPEQVATQLSISTTPAREGLLALRSEGFLELVPRRGFVVRPLARDDISDLFVVRALVAGELAARAAAKADDEDVEQLAAATRDASRAHADGEMATFRLCNRQFLQVIYDAARAPKIEWFMGTLVRYVPSEFWESVEGWPELVLDVHARFVPAFASGEAEEARLIMSSHVRKAGNLVAAQWGKAAPQLVGQWSAGQGAGRREFPATGPWSTDER
jgi:DNA-binding GntR family transcriptional regulator